LNLNRTWGYFCGGIYLKRRRGRDEDHCIIVEQGALIEYEKNIF
jgi:hypothetical protein